MSRWWSVRDWGKHVCETLKTPKSVRAWTEAWQRDWSTGTASSDLERFKGSIAKPASGPGEADGTQEHKWRQREWGRNGGQFMQRSVVGWTSISGLQATLRAKFGSWRGLRGRFILLPTYARPFMWVSCELEYNEPGIAVGPSSGNRPAISNGLWETRGENEVGCMCVWKKPSQR
ncbi:hypothetical protein GOP47_0020116 [Adiantum capillus-veneris]|uniref:Uncharacterized protein n=1 Tax=Adiantum capillus-veneris TaxID=13818 RepID=A0A9D4UCD8_ADICA|nr:hypothetical protein GOP47_0020116 [Adiantum capillus-veneris]